VPARPDVLRDVQRPRKLRVGGQERIVVTVVEPHREPSQRGDSSEDVVARVVRRVVEGAGRARAATRPDGCRMSADGAELAGSQAREVKSAVAAHRNATDRDLPFRVEEVLRVGDHVVEHERSPLAVAPVVPVAVVAAVREHDDRGVRPVERRE